MSQQPQSNVPARVPMAAGGQVAALIPQTMEEAFRVSQAIAASGMAPKGIDKPEQVLVAIMAGAELGLAPFQSLQSFAVVNGRPTLWGDGLLAVVLGRGVRVRERLEGEGDGMVAICQAIRPDNGEEIERMFSVADAKKAGLWGKAGPWQQYPKRMLQMRARALSLRDGCADMLRGISVREEVEDYQPIHDVTPRKADLRAKLSAQTGEGFSEKGVDAAIEGRTVEAEQVEEIEAEVVDTDPPLKTGAQLLAEKMAEQAEAAEDAADAEFTETADASEASSDIGQDTAPALDPELIENIASFKRAIKAMDDPEEIADAGTAVRTYDWFKRLKTVSRPEAQGVLDAVATRLGEVEGPANG